LKVMFKNPSFLDIIIEMQVMMTPELSKYLKINEKNVYKLIRESGLPSMDMGRRRLGFDRELIDKWILEKMEWVPPLLLAGCDDDLLRKAVDHYNSLDGGSAYYAPVGSIKGLKALRDSRATMACVRMPEDVEAKDDLSYVDRCLDAGSYVVVPLFPREQGIIVRTGNPKKIRSIKDIAAKGATFTNRNQGSETRLLLDSLLKKSNIDPMSIRGYEVEVDSHFEVGLSVLKGTSDAGFGAGNVARMLGVDHVPLHKEIISVVIPKHRHYNSDVKAFLSFFEPPL
jgi:putative molybdopterin biosynthesis protein